ncbi:unnamed protein product [Ostreobium quekettii]|uniref:PDZ domain-containing protein n=1 Tax=Ostreobium quekettii TaxID=121088 RepID=A0A8S1IZB7_9CHLO|nr:unnamed protein product [Ostreobium quekettii]|eukprot:evm.model.scf_851.3 EVM.evm.TU.scf_851.3   scf_851:27623-32073(+)
MLRGGLPQLMAPMAPRSGHMALRAETGICALRVEKPRVPIGRRRFGTQCATLRRRQWNGPIASRAEGECSARPAGENEEVCGEAGTSGKGENARGATATRMVKRLLAGGVVLGAGVAAAAATGAELSYGPNPGGLAEAVAIIAMIVAVHEGGHFLAARSQNIHVSKFSIGFGPALLKYQGEEVEYSLRAIPLGGFVSFPDNDAENPYPLDDPDLLRNRTIPERALVISAGVIANFMFAFGILLAQVTTVGVADRVYQPGVRVPAVTHNSVAETSGLKANDTIISVDGVPVVAGASSVSNVVDAINSSPDQKLTLLVNRGGKTLPITVIPEKDFDGKGRIGLQLVSNATVVRTKANDLFQAVVLASNEFSRMCGDITRALQNFAGNFKVGELSGPLGAVAVGAEVAQADSSQLFQFAAVININLAIVNMLPMPALDGGFLALLAVEAARGGRKLPQGVENGVMASGWLVLMTLGVVLLVKDTFSLGIFRNLL